MILINVCVQIFGFLVLMCVILAVGHGIWEHYEASYTTYIPRERNVGSAFSAFLTFWSYIIILNTVVPISLYVRYCVCVFVCIVNMFIQIFQDPVQLGFLSSSNKKF